MSYIITVHAPDLGIHHDTGKMNNIDKRWYFREAGKHGFTSAEIVDNAIYLKRTEIDGAHTSESINGSCPAHGLHGV